MKQLDLLGLVGDAYAEPRTRLPRLFPHALLGFALMAALTMLCAVILAQ